MARWALLIDHELCFDCRACEVACKQENNLPPDSHWIRVLTIGPRKVGDNILIDFVPVTCTHCAKPPCAEVCPTEAIKKREDGIVTIDESLCSGCMACMPACPFGVIGLNAERNVVDKCTLCSHRVERGLRPACVQHCEAGAILFGEVNEVTRQLAIQRAQRRISRSY